MAHRYSMHRASESSDSLFRQAVPYDYIERDNTHQRALEYSSYPAPLLVENGLLSTSHQQMEGPYRHYDRVSNHQMSPSNVKDIDIDGKLQDSSLFTGIEEDRSTIDSRWSTCSTDRAHSRTKPYTAGRKLVNSDLSRHYQSFRQTSSNQMPVVNVMQPSTQARILPQDCTFFDSRHSEGVQILGLAQDWKHPLTRAESRGNMASDSVSRTAIPPRVPEVPRLPTPALELICDGEFAFCSCCRTNESNGSAKGSCIPREMSNMDKKLNAAKAYIHGMKRENMH
ncbi:hypothetical protein BKA67DRAFT_183435 [Truncatella angustata]|uniref:Uncharacterized protein n=1 Tax=Truncatella angustata TaxID=152316 RepID=A0A9P8US82_9PEZI|nr:uncharacterized protein BKA67DRAFT_183435 [Truncatella angustata]KAH6657241.1 hypothetical protein BKA67DRAFT_183435 [Truncatella angustata]